MRTDTERLDALQKLIGVHSSQVICRWSSQGRGWRLHESTIPGSKDDIREAIDAFLDSVNANEEENK